MEIKHAKDIKRNQDYSALIYAQPGTGKTSTLKHLPGKTLVIDVDRTTNVLAGIPNVDVVYLDETLVPDKFIKQVPQIQGRDVLNALKSGDEVPGTKLVQSRSIRVR